MKRTLGFSELKLLASSAGFENPSCVRSKSPRVILKGERFLNSGMRVMEILLTEQIYDSMKSPVANHQQMQRETLKEGLEVLRCVETQEGFHHG